MAPPIKNKELKKTQQEYHLSSNESSFCGLYSLESKWFLILRLAELGEDNSKTILLIVLIKEGANLFTFSKQ